MQRVAFVFLWLYIFTVPLENVVQLPGLGTITSLIGMLAFGIGVLHVIDRNQIRLPCKEYLPMFALMFLGGLSFYWSVAPELTLQRIWTFLQLVATVWLIWEITQRHPEQENLMQAYVLGAYVSAFDTFINYQSSQSLDYMRYVASGFDPNDLGVTLALGIPIACYLSVMKKGIFMVWVNRFYVPIALLAILLTASRGAFLSSLVALLFIPLTFKKLPFRFKASLVFIIALVIYVGLEFVPESSWDRLATIQTEMEGGDLSKRTDIWQAGLELFFEHPLLGVGIGAFKVGVGEILGYEMVAHNTFLSILVELGVVGFGLFTVLILLLLLSLRRLSPLKQKLWSILLLTWAVGAFSLSWEYQKPTWLLFGWLVTQAACKEQQLVSNSYYKILKWM